MWGNISQVPLLLVSFRTAADYFDLLWTFICKIITLYYNYHSMLIGCNSCCKIFKKNFFYKVGHTTIIHPISIYARVGHHFLMSCLGAMSVFFGKKGFFDKGNPLSHSLDIMDRSVMAIRGATRKLLYMKQVYVSTRCRIVATHTKTCRVVYGAQYTRGSQQF